jgi:hypothetical protein
MAFHFKTASGCLHKAQRFATADPKKMAISNHRSLVGDGANPRIVTRYG